MAHQVALIEGFGVGAVGHVGLSALSEVAEDFCPCGSEEGAHHVAIDSGHTREPVNAAAAHEVEQEGFVGVVLMVGYGNGGSTALLAQGFKPSIAQVARCHFNAYAAAARLLLCVKTNAVQAHLLLLAEANHKLLIALALFTAQLEIAMRGLHLVTRLAEQQQKRYAVGTATQAHQDAGGLFGQYVGVEHGALLVISY